MLNALIFVVLLLVAVVLVTVVLVWKPREQVTPEKARMVRASAGIGALLIFFAAGSLMLGGMKTVKGESDEFEVYQDDPELENSEGDVDGDSPTETDRDGTVGGDPADEVSAAETAESDTVLNEPGPPEPPTPEGVDPDAPVSAQLEQVRVGALSRETIRESIETMKPYVKGCYEDMLKEFPEAAGKVVIEFTIIGEGGKGRVEMSELEAEKTTLFDSKLHDCMLEAVGDLEFEVPEGGGKVKVRYPFNFETDKEPMP